MVKLKLKKKVWQIGIPLLLTTIVGIILGTNFYNDYKYKQTYEYKLISHGYTKEETEKLLNYFQDEEKRNQLLEKEKNSTILELIKEKYYIHSNLESYLAYKEKNKKKSNNEIIAVINTHQEENAYEETKESDTEKGILININKFYKVNEDYEPQEITNINLQYAYANNKLANVANEAFVTMWNAAKEQDLQLIVNTSYRSYKSQETMYENTKAANGSRTADNMVARPGHSDHQTGLSIDVYEKNYQTMATFKDSPAYTWLKENAYKYGFIERYPEGKEYITGFTYEPWHWRYVGEEAAKTIHEENITFDEYYAYYVENQA